MDRSCISAIQSDRFCINTVFISKMFLLISIDFNWTTILQIQQTRPNDLKRFYLPLSIRSVGNWNCIGRLYCFQFILEISFYPPFSDLLGKCRPNDIVMSAINRHCKINLICLISERNDTIVIHIGNDENWRLLNLILIPVVLLILYDDSIRISWK